MKRFALTLAILVAAAGWGCGVAQAQYGYYGTFRGGGRNVGYSHVRSFAPPGSVFIQSYSPPSGYGYYGEAYGYGAGAPGYGYGPGCYHHHHHQGYARYGYGGYSAGPGISIRW